MSRREQGARALKPSHAVTRLASLVAVLAVVATSIGLFAGGESEKETATTVRGERVELYGEGIYRHDAVFKGATNRGTDAVTLALAVPLLMLAIILYRGGSMRGGLLLTGALAWFLYLYASLALGTAFNALFPLYVALFSASLFGFVLAFASVRAATTPSSFSKRLPRRGLAILMLASGAITLVVWLGPPARGPSRGRGAEAARDLDHHGH